MENIELIRRLIAAGMTDAEIAAEIDDIEAEARDCEEERRGEAFERDDWMTAGERATCDRLDMGRNEAGEWLGFM